MILCAEDGRIAAVTQGELPQDWKDAAVTDYGDKLIIPGMVDLHVHAPQYGFHGFAMDMELIDWLNTYTFPEEGKFSALDYAEKSYAIFVEELKRSHTTRACIFGTLHGQATLLLMELLDRSGLITMVGKVNQDRNSPDYLREESAEKSLLDTEQWILESQKFVRTRPILTPRFLPTCSDSLMRGLSLLQKKYGLCMQSHLSENKSEIEWVRQLCPDSSGYGDAYEKRGCLGTAGPVIMAHCVHSDPEEMDLLKKRGVFVAHCPQSNMNLASGIAPMRRFLRAGIRAGLGTDCAGGAHLSMMRAVTDAVQASKLYWRMVDEDCPPLKFSESFYLATKGGGAIFGKVGSFEPGYACDALVLDDSSLKHPQMLENEQRLERMLYLSDERHIAAKYVEGKQIF